MLYIIYLLVFAADGDDGIALASGDSSTGARMQLSKTRPQTNSVKHYDVASGPRILRVVQAL